ncbi:MAG: T9SS type A sorting domain-containing protein, partial [bacterium]
SWTAVNRGLTNFVVLSLAVSGTNLFAGTYGGGVLLSTNRGASWTAINTDLANSYVYSLAVARTELLAGTFGGGVWRRPLSDIITSVENPSADLPAHFNLDQNHPNPFNPTTTITYSLNQTGQVVLKVFNVIGEEVVKLVNGIQVAGHHEVKFDATDFPGGVYFYRLQAGGLTETRRMVLVK